MKDKENLSVGQYRIWDDYCESSNPKTFFIFQIKDIINSEVKIQYLDNKQQIRFKEVIEDGSIPLTNLEQLLFL